VERDPITAANATFWDELCGSTWARNLGITEHTPESLRRLDAAYLALYPYLFEYLPIRTIAGKRILEIGLGYGTFGQILAGLAVDYTGLDLAATPVSMMQQRLAWLGLTEETSRAIQGSALEMPFADASFDMVYAIGSLHHTGDLPRALAEVRRVLRPGGTTIFMVYNGRSYRRAVVRASEAKQYLLGLRRDAQASDRARYDTNSAGDAAPHTDFVTRRWMKDALRDLGYSSVRVQARNWENLTFRRFLLPRSVMLGTVDRLAGLDLYVTASLP
jgi:ubiquinone/menaquinone biosynthesis C-methylase UbiE